MYLPVLEAYARWAISTNKGIANINYGHTYVRTVPTSGNLTHACMSHAFRTCVTHVTCILHAFHTQVTPRITCTIHAHVCVAPSYKALLIAMERLNIDLECFSTSSRLHDKSYTRDSISPHLLDCMCVVHALHLHHTRVAHVSHACYMHFACMSHACLLSCHCWVLYVCTYVPL